MPAQASLVGEMPDGIVGAHDPEARAVAEKDLEPLAAPTPPPAVTAKQLVIAVALGFVIFAGMLLFLMRSSS